jgi:hypothetical protein
VAGLTAAPNDAALESPIAVLFRCDEITFARELAQFRSKFLNSISSAVTLQSCALATVVPEIWIRNIREDTDERELVLPTHRSHLTALFLTP